MSEAIELGRIGGVWYEVAILVANGPDDCEWESIDGFGDYEHALDEAQHILRTSEGGVRVLRNEDEIGTNLKTDVVWEDGKCI